MKHKKYAIFVAAFALVLLGALPASASGPQNWAPPTNLSDVIPLPTSPQLAAAPDGSLTAVWQQFDGTNYIIHISRSTNGGSSWNAPVAVSGASQNSVNPQIAVGPDSTLTAIWTVFSGGSNAIQTSHSSNGASWSPPFTLATVAGEASTPQIVAANGVITAVWQGASGGWNTIQASRSTDGLVWSVTPVDVSAAGGAAASPRVAVTSPGVLTAAWTRFDGSNYIAQSARSSDGGITWSVPASLSAAGRNASVPQVSVASGGASAVWLRFDGTNEVVQASHSADGVSWSAPATLSAVGQDAESPQLAAAPGGGFTAVWNRSDGANAIVQASHSADGVVWSAPTGLSASGGDALAPQIVAAGDGSLTAVWARFNGSHIVVQSSYSVSGASWGVPVDISVDGASDGQQIVVAPNGSLTAIWENDLSTGFVVQSASVLAAPAVTLPPAAAPTRPRPAATPTPTPAPTAPSESSGTTSETPPVLKIEFGFTVGQRASGGELFLTGDGFVPGNVVTVTLHSMPTMLGIITTSATGSFDQSLTLPTSLETGTHHVEVTYTNADGTGATQSWYFAVDGSDVVTKLQTEPTAEPPSWAQATSPTSTDSGEVTIRGVTYQRYLPAEHPAESVDTVISSLVLLTLLGGVGAISVFGGNGTMAMAGTAVAAGAATRDHERPRGGASLASAKVKHLKFKQDATARGDRSSTWAWPGRERLDALSLTAPQTLNRFSPLLARVVNDGAYLRAMVGPLWLSSSVVGIVLGVLGVLSTGGAAVPPALGLTIAIVVLSAFDVWGGLLAAATFTLGVTVLGELGSFAEVRTLLGIDVIFFTVALTASAARPLRRLPAQTAGDWFDRIADVTIATLIGTWAVVKMIGALPALSGLELPIASSALTVAVCVGASICARYVLETVVAYNYPLRLATVAPPKIGFPSPYQQIASAVFKTVLFVFVAIAYLGNVWPLWVGAALFLIPSIIAAFQAKLPNVPRLVKLIPGGIVKLVLMLCVGKLLGGWLFSTVHNPQDAIGQAFVILSIPSLILGFAGFFGRDGDRWEINWPFRIGGVVVLVFGVLLVLGVVRLS